MREQTPTSDAATKPSSPAPLSMAKLNCHVLLAEDGIDNQRLIGLILKKAGARVSVVEDGQQAIS